MKEKLRDILKKYRFAALVALAGVVLMLLPGKKDSMPDAETAEGESFSLEETERRMAEVLGAMDGVGRVQVMLTLRSGETLSQRLYPTYQGAVVVCQGAGDSRVRLRVMETVAVLTGLSSDKISVVQWKQ